MNRRNRKIPVCQVIPLLILICQILCLKLLLIKHLMDQLHDRLIRKPRSQSINRLKTVQNLLISRRRKNLRVLHLQLPLLPDDTPPQNKPAAFPDCRTQIRCIKPRNRNFPRKICHSGRDHLKIPHLIHIHTRYNRHRNRHNSSLFQRPDLNRLLIRIIITWIITQKRFHIRNSYFRK